MRLPGLERVEREGMRQPAVGEGLGQGAGVLRVVDFPHVVQTLQGADQFVEFWSRQRWPQALPELLKPELTKAWLLQRLGELRGISNIWGTQWRLIFLQGKHSVRTWSCSQGAGFLQALSPDSAWVSPARGLGWGWASPAPGPCSSPAQGSWGGVWPRPPPPELGTWSSSSCVSSGLCCGASPSSTHGPFYPRSSGPHCWGSDQDSRTGCQTDTDTPSGCEEVQVTAMESQRPEVTSQLSQDLWEHGTIPEPQGLSRSSLVKRRSSFLRGGVEMGFK